jgi:hypothetical protein
MTYTALFDAHVLYPAPLRDILLQLAVIDLFRGKWTDQDDRHILAAAIIGRCDVIVTCNIKDFPESALAPYGIEAQHPDEFLFNHLNLAPGLFCHAIRKIRARLTKPPYTVNEYLSSLAQHGLTATVGELTSYSSLI